MSSAKRDLQNRKRTKKRKALLDVLAHTSDVQILQLFWAVNMLQSDEPPDLRRYLKFPTAASKAEIGNDWFVLKWEIENLLLLLLSTDKEEHRVIPGRYFQFNTACILVNLYKEAEQAESRVLLDGKSIVGEIQRIAHKQFLWQRGFFHAERVYRYVYVYGQGACADYFKAKYGLSIDEFFLGCIGLYFHTQHAAWEKVPTLDPNMGVRPEILELTLKIISTDLMDFRAETAKRISDVASVSASKLSYLPSTFRHTPIITSSENGDRIIAPLPQLIMLRATTGLYYDLADGPQKLFEEANDRFEQYGKKLIEARYPRFKVSREQEFGSKKGRLKTPDLLLRDGDEIKVVFECKATKLTFIAQYADDQYAEAPKAFDQIAKGMSQLWKFFSRARRGVYDNEKVSPDAYGVILTMDSWFHLEGTQLPLLRQKAEALVADEPDMKPEDMREVLFCSVEDFDDLLAVSNEDEFLDTLKRSREPEFLGWQLPPIRNPGWEKQLERKPYPFDVAEVLPLWNEIGAANSMAKEDGRPQEDRGLQLGQDS